MFTQPVLDRGKAAVATLLALLLLIAGAIVAPSAHAAGPAVSVTDAARAGGVVTVTGSGFAGVSPGVYLAVGPVGLPGFYAGSSQLGDTVWIAPGNVDGGSGAGRTAPMSAEGTFSVQMSVPAYTDGAQHAIYTSKAHGQGFADTSQNTTTEIAWEQLPAAATTTIISVNPAASSQAGVDFTLGATVTPEASGTVSYFNGSTKLGEAAVGTTVTTSIAAAGTASLTAVFAPAEPAVFTASTSAAVSYEITAVPQPEIPVPTVSVSKTSGLDAAGETITVTGTGFVPSAPATSGTRPPLAGTFTGSYVVFGKFADVWKPSAGATSAARKVLSQKWGVLEADVATIGGAAAGGIVIGADGSFQTTLTVSKTEASELLGGNYGIYTYPGGGASYAPFETYTPLTFADPAPVPTLDVSVTDVSASAGATARVVGSDFGDVTGAYAAIIEKGTEAELTAGGGYVVFGFWATPGAIVGGAFDKTLVAPTEELDPTKEYEVVVWKSHTNPTADTIYARADVPFTADHWKILFPDAQPPVEPQPPVTPTDPLTPQGAGSLKWAISSSFASYVTGPIAHGSIAATNGATRADGVFQFGQAAGSTYDAATGTGTVSYTGAVRFTGHAGVLDVTVANPQVRIASPSSASLYVTSGGSQVAFATLNLAAGTRTATNGTVTYTGVPASLTAAGQSDVLEGFTTELDPVTFTVGIPSAAPAGSTGTIAAAAPAAAKRSIPSAPPAATGIDLDDDALAALQSGGTATVSASGFEPNESGIQVVVYSTPTLLGEVTADASGTATWTGSLPATLTDGEHTLTFQGSVDRGIRFTLARAAIATSGCVVDGASLNWGFKESFRTYVEGIAAGGWELTDLVYEYPAYVWTGGTGTVDAEARTGLVTYGGSIRFTGHSGALDTTLSNARVELAGDTGYVVFDVSGTTQAGEPVTAEGIRFAEFALPDLELTDDGLVLDTLPATLTAAGAAAFGTYPAGEELDPVSAVLPLTADCAVDAVAVDADVPVAEAAEIEAVSAESSDAPVWPWAVGGIALVLVIGALVWIVVSRRRATAGGSGDSAAD
ncbi:HtaA domain-containing protein [Microbacterium allomyrinae]|uniref:HtaA domain-containing protein n=1 Tax=Microbacterium allomyrinae TaxID=2830666 RepID=A0A9X1LWF9_9MICO|nr:HtaA domain-containing protein [Microbacterium allomyrinae]MCC2032931.1 HtaA domain-containing protein [Microbacterium allomyrinae]